MESEVFVLKTHSEQFKGRLEEMRAQIEKELELPTVLASLESGIFAHVKKMSEIVSHL